MGDYPNQDEYALDFDFENAQFLGQGTYGFVQKIQSKRPLTSNSFLSCDGKSKGDWFAVKFLETTSPQAFQKLQMEHLILEQIPKHTNIIQLIKAYAWIQTKLQATYNLVLVLELGYKSLGDVIDERRKSNNYFQDDELFYIFRQCIETFHFLLEKKNITHRDIKPENILLAKPNSLDLKITDFGVSKTLFKQKLRTIQGTLVGTPVYLAPALWQVYESSNFQIQKIGKIKHNAEKSDIYSLGVSLLQCTLLLKEEVCQMNHKVIGPKKTENILNNIKNQKIKEILQAMLVHDEKSRISYDELMKKYFSAQPQTSIPQKGAPESTIFRRNSPSERTKIFSEQRVSVPKINLLPPSLKPKQKDLNQSQFSESQEQDQLEVLKTDQSFEYQQSDKQYCPSHQNQQVTSFCFHIKFERLKTLKLNLFRFICDLCQLSDQEKKDTISIKEYQQTKDKNKFRDRIKQNIEGLYKNLRDLLTSQQKQFQESLSTLEEQLTITLKKCILQTTQNIKDQFALTQEKFNQAFANSLEAFSKENNIIDEKTSIKRLMQLQQEIQRKSSELKNSPSNIDSNLNYNFIVQLKHNINEELTIENSNKILNSQFSSVQTQFKDSFKSKEWRISQNNIEILKNDKNIKLEMEASYKLPQDILILNLFNEEYIYYQNSDLDLFKTNFRTFQNERVFQLKEKILCFDKQTDQLIFGTDQGRIYRVTDDVQVVRHVEGKQITAIRISKNGLIYGTEKGEINSLIERNEFIQVEKIDSQHKSRIIQYGFIFSLFFRLEYYNHFDCLVSAAENSRYITLYCHDQPQQFDTKVSQITSIQQFQKSSLLVADGQKGIIIIWNLQQDQQDQIHLNLSLQTVIADEPFKYIFGVATSFFILTNNYFRGVELNESVDDFYLNNKLNESKISNIAHNKQQLFTYAVDSTIYVWSVKVTSCEVKQ